MNDSGVILFHATLAFALAVAGGVISSLFGLSHQRLCALISLAAGTLLGVTFFGILPESSEATRWWELGLGLISGYALFFVISKYVHHVCPACAASHFDEATTHRFNEFALLLVIALSIHSTSDGLALAVGREAHEGAGGLHNGLDWSLLLAICVHKVPEGLALAALLLGAGCKRAGTIAWVAAVESTTLLGALLGLVFLREMSPLWLGLVLAHVGGGFLYLAAHAVLGEMVKHGKTLVLANFAAGVLLIAALTLALRWL